MSGIKDIVKGGWHPKGKEGGKESWRGENKGLNQVAGWIGKGKDTSRDTAYSHQSTPLSSLKDPATFAPPPKRGAVAPPPPTTSESSGITTPANPAVNANDAARQSRYNTRQQETEEAEERPPPRPYRVDTTGLSTNALPLPPRRRDTPSEALPSAPSTSRAPPPPAPNKAGAGPPRLPPRLPPRQNSHPDLHTPLAPPTYQDSLSQPAVSEATLNQGAMDRLGRAGVKIPGFNIGTKPAAASPPLPSRTGSGTATPTSNWNDIPEDMLGAPRSRGTSRSPRTASPGASGHGGQLNELQARFARLNKPGSGTDESSAASNSGATQGTSWAQKQAALNTANSFRQDPGSVSLSDARSAATTARSFQERHGEQVASGFKAAQGLQQRFAPGSASGGAANPTSPVKKAPPPPPPKKKKPELSGGAIVSPSTSEHDFAGSPGAPPPIPFSSKPK